MLLRTPLISLSSSPPPTSPPLHLSTIVGDLRGDNCKREGGRLVGEAGRVLGGGSACRVHTPPNIPPPEAMLGGTENLLAKRPASTT